MTCPFLHRQCEGCKKWRCNGYVPPFMITEHLETCKADSLYLDCPNYKVGVEFRENIRLSQLRTKGEENE